MSVQNRPEPYSLGLLVKIRGSQFRRARIVEIRGNLGPQGARVYRLMYRGKPHPAYIEIPESYIVPLDETGRDDRATPAVGNLAAVAAAPESEPDLEPPRIVADPAVMRGQPVVAGTRITVESILERLAAGESVKQLIRAEPQLTRAAIRAALGFAARVLRADVASPVASQPV